MPEINEGNRVLGIFTAGLILAIGSEPLADFLVVQYPTWAEPIRILGYGLDHLGVVLVVAMLVRQAIERASQREFLKIINTEVTTQVGRSIHEIAERSLAPMHESVRKIDEELGFAIRRPGLLDKESLELLKDKVLSPQFIRSDFLLELKFYPFLDKDGKRSESFLRVDRRSYYHIMNLTNKEAHYTVEAWMDLMPASASPDGGETGHFTRFTSDVVGSTDGELRSFNLDDLKQKQEIQEDHGGLWLHHVMAQPIAPGKTHYVDVRGSQILRTQELFVWNLSALTRSFKVSVEFSGGFTPADFRLGALELHHLGHEAFQASKKVEGNTVSWEIRQVLLPSQGVKLFWSPSANAPGS